MCLGMFTRPSRRITELHGELESVLITRVVGHYWYKLTIAGYVWELAAHQFYALEPGKRYRIRQVKEGKNYMISILRDGEEI